MTPSRRSHPPALIRLVERQLLDQQLVHKGQRLLAAVSGGPDSMALLHVLALLQKKCGYQLFACGVDHGLRAEAAGELALGKALADSLQVPFETVTIQVQVGSNLMARAREARYQVLRDVARKLQADAIAIGHHADDRAETVLIRLLQGAGPAGLAVLPPRTGDIIRPLLSARRSDIVAHLTRHHIEFAEDPSNRNPKFLRASVRAELLPLLSRLSPRIVEHLCQLAEDLSALELPAASPHFKRAHLQQLARAAQSGNRAISVALPAGKVAKVHPHSGTITIESAPPPLQEPPTESASPDPE